MRKFIVLLLLAGLTATPGFASSRKHQKVRPVNHEDDVLVEDEADYAECDDAEPSVSCPETKTPPRIFWGSVDLLYWWTKDAAVSTPLVTSGGSTVIDGSGVELNGTAGANFTFGVQHPSSAFGWEIGGFFLGDRSKTANAASGATGSPALARPYTSTTGAASSLAVSVPGTLRGDVGALATSSLWGLDTNITIHPERWAWGDPEAGVVLAGDLLAGFRYVDLDEVFAMGQTSNLTSGTMPFTGAALTPPTAIRVVDVFDTTNRFYGPQVGTRFELAWGRWYLDALGKVAFGVTQQTVGIHGNSTAFTPSTGPITGPGTPARSYGGGLYALPTNTGITGQSQFGVVPELALTVGYNATENLRVYFGYNFLYWSSVVRPGDQVDTTVNPTQLPTSPTFGTLAGAPRPAASFTTSDFWAQGFHLGLAYRF